MKQPYAISDLNEGMIVEILEKVAMDNPVVGHEWVLGTLLTIGIPFGVICQEIDRLYDSKTLPWSTPAATLHLVEELTHLFERWLATPHTKSSA